VAVETKRLLFGSSTVDFFSFCAEINRKPPACHFFGTTFGEGVCSSPTFLSSLLSLLFGYEGFNSFQNIKS